MLHTHRVAVGAIALIIGLGSVQSLCAQTSWDRRVEQIAVVAQPGDPAGTYRITGAWAVDVSTATTLSLDTKVTISKNGTAIWSGVVDVDANVGAVAGCGPCQANTICLCGPWGCTCCDCPAGGACACTTWINTSAPGPIALQNGDTLTVSLVAASGAVLDTNTGNDVKTLSFAGKPSFWNRRLVSAQLTPSPCPSAPHLYDLHYGVAYDMTGIAGEIELFGELQLVVDNSVAYVGGLCQDSPWFTTTASCITGGLCNDDVCGFGSCAGASANLDCVIIELHGGAVETCVCSSGTLNYVVSGISIPGLGSRSTVKCGLSGDRHSALPELTALNSDDSQVVPFTLAPTPCNADINNDGIVDAADLALVLGAWGQCPQ